MSHAKKNRKDKKLPEVLTGHDEKALRESPDRSMFERESDRPNGCSGNYC